MQMQSYAVPGEVEVVQQRFIARVFGWMGIGLGTTGLVALYTVATPGILNTLMTSPGLLIGLIIAELGLVIALSAGINRFSSMVATGMFFLYAALTGLTLSSIFVVYTAESIASTFFICAGTFAAMSVYGYVTKTDLTRVGSIAFMGLIGIIIASVANFFFKSSALGVAVSYIGVIVFVGLTAYDVQQLKAMGPMLAAGSESERKGAIIGALRLYLDFINLFLMLLQIFGRRR